MGLVRITLWYPNFNGSHFGLPPSEITRMTGLPPKIVWTMTYSHRPHCPNASGLTKKATMAPASKTSPKPQTVSRQECERQQCERHQCEANSANANSAKGSTVRMPTVRMRQRCECQQCECDSSAKDDSPNCAKPCPQLRQLDLDFRQAFFVLLYPSFTHKRSTIGVRNSAQAFDFGGHWSTDFFRQRSEKVHESTEKTTSARNRILSVETDKLEPWATSPSSSLDRPLPSLRHRELLGKWHLLEKTRLRFNRRKRIVPSKARAPQCLHSQVMFITSWPARRCPGIRAPRWSLSLRSPSSAELSRLPITPSRGEHTPLWRKLLFDRWTCIIQLSLLEKVTQVIKHHCVHYRQMKKSKEKRAKCETST